MKNQQDSLNKLRCAAHYLRALGSPFDGAVRHAKDLDFVAAEIELDALLQAAKHSTARRQRNKKRRPHGRRKG